MVNYPKEGVSISVERGFLTGAVLFDRGKYLTYHKLAEKQPG